MALSMASPRLTEALKPCRQRIMMDKIFVKEVPDAVGVVFVLEDTREFSDDLLVCLFDSHPFLHRVAAHCCGDAIWSVPGVGSTSE